MLSPVEDFLFTELRRYNEEDKNVPNATLFAAIDFFCHYLEACGYWAKFNRIQKVVLFFELKCGRSWFKGSNL